MAQTQFFAGGEGITLADLAGRFGGRLIGTAAPDRRVTGLAPLHEARPSDLSFFDNHRYADALQTSAAGCIILSERHLKLFPGHAPGMLVRDPQRAFGMAGQALYPAACMPQPITRTAGIASSATIDPSARLEEGVVVEANAVIGPDVQLGRGSLVSCGAVIGPGCRIGRDCRIGPQTTVTHALLGDRVILHPGVRIGQDGFGYAPGRDGILKLVQVGRVIIQDDVEIGANSTVDRGAIRDTVIGEGTKIDNQVQVGHNVRIGRNCLIVAQVAIAGSATIGDFVALGGQSAVRGHVTIGNGAQIAAVSSVAGDVPAGARWGGVPAKPVREWFREMAILREMGRARRTRGGNDEPSDGDA